MDEQAKEAIDHLTERLNELESFAVRLNQELQDERQFIRGDREARITEIEVEAQATKKKLETQRRKEDKLSKLLFVFGVSVFLGLTGLSYQSGQFNWLLDTSKAKEAVEVVGAIATAAAAVGTGVIAAQKSGEN